MKTYDEVVEFHGHSCPGLALGYRVSLRVLREFKGRAEDEELVAIVENNSCAVDAIQVMTGCTFGKGNLIFRDYGKQVYTFLRRPSGKSIRISVDWKRPAETEEEKAVWEKYSKGDRSKKVLQFVHDRKASRIRYILEADERELLAVRKGSEKLPPAAEIYRSVVCEGCGEKVAEPGVRIRDGRLLCIPCFGKKE
ncbi:MAG: FmdE family protein [Nitrospiraceae bacterium]|nr:FmdE family protein [Nitrospiraceae bacterium]